MRSDRLEAVLLDMGGVLVPEVPGYEDAVHNMELLQNLRQFGVGDPERLIVESSRRLRNAYRAQEPEATQPDPGLVFVDLAAPVRRSLLDAFRREAVRPPADGVRELVATLAQRYKLGLVSNTVIPGDHHERSLESAGILQHLDAAAWSANFGRRKPDPAIVLHVLNELGAAAEAAVFVGDKIRTDILAAKRAGLRSIWLSKPGTPHTGEAEPDFIIRDLNELPALLLQLG